jgi:SAM-dependent methyltransferase
MKYPVKFESTSPSKDAIMRIERAIQSIRPDSQEMLDWYLRYSASHKFRLAFDLDQVKAVAPQNAKVIDIGAVPLLLTFALSTLDYDIIGVDIAPDRFATVINSLGLVVKKADIERDELSIEQGVFDVAIFNEIFEHLRINLIETHQKILNLLKPGGILLLSTPNLLSLTGYLNLLFYKKGPGNVFDEYNKLEKLGHMGHVREYSVKEVCHFLEMIEFEIELVIYRGRYTPKSFWKRLLMSSLLLILPKMRPYFTVIARKPIIAT